MLKKPQSKEEESKLKSDEDSPNTKIKKKWDFKLSLFNLHNNKALSPEVTSKSELEPEQPAALPKPEKPLANSSEDTSQHCST
jgi:hypothetical protein